MYRLKPGDIAILDKENTLNQAGNNMAFVKILEEMPYIPIIGRSYKCVLCNKDGTQLNNEALVVRDDKLCKYNEETIIFRYPEDVPIVIPPEVDALKRCFDISSDCMTEQERVHLKKLIAKLQFFTNITREY